MVPFQSLPKVFDLKIHGDLALFDQLLLAVLFLFNRLQFVDLQEIFADADGIVELDLPESLKGVLEHCDFDVLANFFLHRIYGLIHFFQRHLDIGKLLFSGQPALIFLVIVSLAFAVVINEGLEYVDVILDVD